MGVAVASGAQSLDPRVRVGDVAWRHIESKYADIVEDILDTLAPEGPYAYTVAPHPTEDGSFPRQEIATTRGQIRDAYENMHRFTQVRSLDPLTEIRGDWYLFVHGIGEGFIKPSGPVVHASTIVLFPTMGLPGITGELIWTRTGKGAPYTAGKSGPYASERAILERHDDLLDCLRSGDAAGAARLSHPGGQTAIRDYVNDCIAQPNWRPIWTASSPASASSNCASSTARRVTGSCSPSYIGSSKAGMVASSGSSSSRPNMPRSFRTEALPRASGMGQILVGSEAQTCNASAGRIQRTLWRMQT